VTATSAPESRAWLREYADAYESHDLLTYASAISFQIITALVPAIMFVFGLLGFFSMQGVWRNELAPDVKGSVSKPAFAIIDDAVTKAITQHQVFWVTIGLAIALWQVSGGVRTVMGALNEVHGYSNGRSWVNRMAVSLGLAVVLGACWLIAIAVVVLGPLLFGDVGVVGGALLFVARWGLAGLLLLFAVAFVLHYAPEREQPVRWVTRGAVLVMGGWIVMSIGFGVYVRYIADYTSIFGSLATIVVLSAYLYAAAVVFLGGVQLDALAPRSS
jgi:membrane protein